jgi:hypothetical protein
MTNLESGLKRISRHDLCANKETRLKRIMSHDLYAQNEALILAFKNAHSFSCTVIFDLLQNYR